MTTAPLTPSTSRDSFPQILIETFEDHALTRITFHGRPCYPARDIGTALGYAQNGKRFADKVTGAWASEMVEGRDYEVLTGDALEALKLAAEHGTSEVPSFAARLLVLYERGLHIALLKTNKRAGLRLRAWLADGAMPALARGKGVDANGEALEGTYVRPMLDTDELNRRRLALGEGRRTLDRLERDGVITARQRGQALLQTFKATMRGVLPDEVLDDLGAGSGPSHLQLPARVPANAVMLPEEAEVVSRAWLSPRGIAAKLQMPGSPRHWDARVGRAITGLGKAMYADEQGQPDGDGLRKDVTLAKTIVVNKQGAGDTLQVDGDTGEPAVTYGHLYHPVRVPQLVRAWLMQHKPEWLGLDPNEAEAARRARQAQQRELAEIRAAQAQPQS